MLENQDVFRKIVDYTLIDNLNYWTSSDLASYVKSKLDESEEFKQNQLDTFVEYIMRIYQEYKTGMGHFRLIDLVKTFCHVVRLKRNNLELLEKRFGSIGQKTPMFRYKSGILKLTKANEQLNFLQQELLRLQPELVRTSLETTQELLLGLCSF